MILNHEDQKGCMIPLLEHMQLTQPQVGIGPPSGQDSLAGSEPTS